MSTPAHAIVNLLVLDRARALPVALGAIAPDVPTFLFYASEKLVLATPERLIWSASFFAPSWQALFDSVHSFPLIAAESASQAGAGPRRSCPSFRAWRCIRWETSSASKETTPL